MPHHPPRRTAPDATPRRAPRAGALLVAGALALLPACAPPEESGPAPDATPTEPSDGASATAADDDEDLDALRRATGRLATTVAGARAALEQAVAGDASGLDRAASLLVAEPGLLLDPTALAAAAGDPPPGPTPAGTPTPTTPAPDATGTPDPAATPAPTAEASATTTGAGPLLPGPAASREETVAYGDLLTEVRTRAREAGAAGTEVLQLLADPVAGDLGAWQRAPGDQLSAVAAAVADATTLDDATTPVLDVDGEVPRALAWVVLGQRRPELAAGAAERALAHLAVVEVALADLDA